MNRTWTARWLATLCATGAISGAMADPVSIVNQGFEANAVANGTFPVLTPTGWSILDPGNILDGALDAVGIVNPTGTTFYPGGVPEGSNAALIYLGGDIGGTPVSLSQTLSATLRANTVYTLNVHVGNIASGTGLPPFDTFGFFNLTGFPGYRVQLLAGGMVLAEDDNTLAGSIPDGTFALSSIRAVIGNEHQMLGQALEIRLTNLNRAQTPENPGIEVNFDNVRLDASAAAPEPASLLLVVPGGMAAIVRLAARRRSRRA
ncbi:MAG: hypothetical protein SFU56_08085 [Capsulimonadales bacterium]|nr:hypothetical protein [Capsulimonadales bacterium]